MRKKENRGGSRQGSGAKPKYNEPTKTIAFRVPVSKITEIKIIIKNMLSNWLIKK
jgi:hypothetical protein